MACVRLCNRLYSASTRPVIPHWHTIIPVNEFLALIDNYDMQNCAARWARYESDTISIYWIGEDSNRMYP